MLMTMSFQVPCGSSTVDALLEDIRTQVDPADLGRLSDTHNLSIAFALTLQFSAHTDFWN